MQIQIRNGFLLPQQVDMQDGIYIVEPKKMTRTLKQNAAMHKYYTWLSEALNNAGYTVQKVLTVQTSWTPALVKELLWRVMQIHLLKKESTTRLTTDEVSLVYNELNHITSTRYGVSVPFPDRDMV